jgi:iron complex transport system substrate-binding protein
MSRRTLAGALLAAAALALGVPCAAVAKRGDFPVTVSAANGRVTIAKRPARIVALSPTATETLFAIGAGRQVVAVDDQSNYPTSAPRTKLSSYRPSAEAVARYRPDLVVTSTTANKLLPALGKLHVPVLLEPSATHIGGAYEQMLQIGRATGHVSAARRLVARMKRSIASAVRAAPKASGLSVYHELSPDYYSATSKTFIGRIYALFGLSNIADKAGKADNGYPQLSAEYVLASNPDIVVLSDTKCCKQSAASVSKRPGWGALAAVKSHRVVPVDDDIASRWGPRIVEFVRIVANVVRRARTYAGE